MNRQNSCVSAVPAAKCERSIFQIRERSDGTSRGCHDLCHPAEIGVAHRDRTTGMAAPLIGLQVGKVCIPGDIDARQGLARLSKERDHLRLVALKEYNLNGKMRLLVEIAPHSLPNRNHFRMVCDSAYPDCLAHRCHGSLSPVFDKTLSVFPSVSSQKSGIPNSDFPMNSRRTSPVGAMTAPACASRNWRSMFKGFENAAPQQARIAAEVTLITTSPAAALVSSTRNIVVSRGCS